VGDANAPLISSLLRDTLTLPLAGAGFDVGPGSILTPVGIVAPLKFFEPIKLRRHIKDVLISLEHGEWTHLLQWYLLTVVPPTPTAPNRPFNPAEVFAYLGRQGAVQTKVTNAAVNSSPTGPDLWFVCCDRFSPTTLTESPRAEDEFDFRCPEVLHGSLAGFTDTGRQQLRADLAASPAQLAMLERIQRQATQNQARWPLLCALLRRRLIKREELSNRAAAFAKHWEGPVWQLLSSLPSVKAKLATWGEQKMLSTFLIGGPSAAQGFTWEPTWQALALVPGAVLTQPEMVTIAQVLVQQRYPEIFQQGSRALNYVWSKRDNRWKNTRPSQLGALWESLLPTEREAILAESKQTLVRS
jgi:hypothetical protein